MLNHARAVDRRPCCNSIPTLTNELYDGSFKATCLRVGECLLECIELGRIVIGEVGEIESEVGHLKSPVLVLFLR